MPIHRAALFSLFVVLFPVCAAADDAPLRIGHIAIQTGDIYSEEEAAHGFAYRFADRLHASTRPSVVRQFLLFREGDVYEPARLAESERNLRALGFLRAVSIVAGPPHDGVVDVTVSTEDAWSLEPGTSAGSSGGVSTYGFQLRDANIGGSGKLLSVSFDRGSQRTRAAIDYSDHAFFSPYRRARFTFAQNSDGYERRVLVGRPFFALEVPRSNELAFEETKRAVYWYENGEEASRYQQRHRIIGAAFGLAVHPNDAQANRWTAGLRFVEDDFHVLPDAASAALPDPRSFRYSFLRFEHVDSQFISRNFIDQGLRFQDYNLGLQWSAEGAVSTRALGAARNSGFVAASGSRGLLLGDSAFAIGTAAFETRLDRGVRNAILSGSFRYIRQFDTAIPQTFVGHAMFHDTWRPDRDLQFFADGDTGLRGYRLYAFEGSRNLVVNFEQRFYFGRELLQLISPGVVVFADVGKATNRQLWLPSGFRSDVGAGIRIGLPRAPRNTLRLDFAYPLERDATGRRRLLVSFSSGQAF